VRKHLRLRHEVLPLAAGGVLRDRRWVFFSVKEESTVSDREAEK
jgi:hypothetical protein